MDAQAHPGPWMEPGREAGLLLAAQRGDRAAFDELLRAHRRPLWRVVLALTRHRGEAEALAQETAVRAWKNLAQARVGQPFFPWLVRLVRSLAVARARRRAGESNGIAPLRPNGESWETGATGAHDVHFEQRILASFGELSVDEQLLLALRLFERLSYADVAATLDVPLVAAMHKIAALRERVETGVQRMERAA